MENGLGSCGVCIQQRGVELFFVVFSFAGRNALHQGDFMVSLMLKFC
jgi:hypothetical protein